MGSVTTALGLQLRIGGRRHRLFDSPAAPQAPSDRVSFGKTQPLAPLFYGQAFAVVLKNMIPGGVARLRTRQRPAAVVWRVVAIVIFAIYRVTRRWSRTHIGQKVLKRIQPSVADGDSSTAIARKLWISRVVAADFHFAPRLVFRRPPFALRIVSVLETSSTSRTEGAQQAAARSRTAWQPHDKLCAAVARCAPVMQAAFPFMRKSEHDEFTLSVTAAISSLEWHGAYVISRTL